MTVKELRGREGVFLALIHEELRAGGYRFKSSRR